MMKNINIYLYGHTNRKKRRKIKAWSLKHLNCCSVELRTWKLVKKTSITDFQPLQTEPKGKMWRPGEKKRNCKASRFYFGCKFKMSPYPQSHNILLLFFVFVSNLCDPTKSGQNSRRETRQGFADWYLRVNPGQTWGHFPLFFFFLYFFVCLLWSLRFTLFKTLFFSQKFVFLSGSCLSLPLSHSFLLFFFFPFF